MTHELQDRHALITGAGAGIGAAIALQMAQAGSCLTLCGLTQGTLQAQVEALCEQVPDVAVLIAPLAVADEHTVVGLNKALALQFARKGVTVNAICPCYTETDIVREAVQNIVSKTGKSEAEARQALAASNRQQRLVQPHEVEQSLLRLCAAGSDAINGQAIAMDGGELVS